MTSPTNATDAYKKEIREIFINPTTLYVATDGDYATIQAAIDSITDAAVDKPYTIRVSSGNYVAWDIGAKNYISIIGSGNATIVDVGFSGVTSIKHQGIENTIESMQIRWNPNDTLNQSNNNWCIAFTGTTTMALFKDLKFVITSETGNRSGAIFAWGTSFNVGLVAGTEGYGLKAEHIDIITDMSGIDHVTNTALLNDVNVFMTSFPATDNIVPIHTGLRAKASVNRIFWNGGTLQSGYGFGNKDQTGVTMYGIHNDSTTSNMKIELRDVSGILRNDNVGAVATSWLRCETTNDRLSDIRLYSGCRCQCEGQGVLTVADTPYTNTVSGRILIGTRESCFGGRVIGNVLGHIVALDNTWNAWEAEKREITAGGEWHCDTSTAAFSIALQLQNEGSFSAPLLILNSDFGGANDLTITGGTGTPATFDVEGVGAAQTTVVIAPGTSRIFYQKKDGNYHAR